MSRFDRLALIAVTGLAALLRLPGIEARGRFDADQGHDMLTLVAFTREGIVPLLGPRTSVGEFHHGAFYYFLLAPAAAISNGDPVVVTAFMALLGIGAVALTWWLARAIGGPLAGALAGLLLAVSPAAIEESTFIWNPNPIAFFAVLALAAAWRARTAGGTGRAAWWALAIGAAGAVTQLHVLGIVFLIAMLAAAIAAIRRDRVVAIGVLGGLLMVVVLFVPLIAFELQNGFLETQRVLDYVGGGDEPIVGNPVGAIAFTLLRVVGWPLVGVVTDVPILAALLLALTVGLAAVGVLRARGEQRLALTSLLALLAWSTLALAFAAPSLQRVVAGLPNDHYHAFVDPVIVILIAVPAAGLFETAMASWRGARRPTAALGGVGIVALIAVLVLVPLSRKPPHVDPDGGWPAMRAAGERIVATAAGDTVAVFGLPEFKLPDAVRFPIQRAGGDAVAPSSADLFGFPYEFDVDAVVVACDRLFEAVIGRPCGGPAEDAYLTELVTIGSGVDAELPPLIDRFDASPRTSISVYGTGRP